MTSVLRPYPTRISCTFMNKEEQIILDQIQTIDKNRLLKKMGSINQKIAREICQILSEMFAY